MTYRKLKADGIFTGNKMLGSDSVLVCQPDGRIETIIPLQEAGESIESFMGILSPGLINAHCHLELSHLRGLIPQKTGLVDFVFSVVTQRHFPEQEIYDAIDIAEGEMIQNGIVAVGDICNNTLTIPRKEKQHLDYYNFVELSGWLPAVAHARFERSKTFYDEFLRLSGSVSQASMCPHAPYSVSNELWKMMEPFFAGKTITIHNQETAWEDELFLQGTGDANRMYELMKIDNSFFRPTGKSSLQSYFGKLSDASQRLLVHNTFVHEEDVAYATQVENSGTLYFCLCPKANLYIENKLPPVGMLRRQDVQIVLGTDSLASNDTLDILDEIRTISRAFPKIPLSEMLQWVTFNAARALQMDSTLGSFDKGKKPGVILLDDIEGEQLSGNSRASRII